jgi:hypothetical protein
MKSIDMQLRDLAYAKQLLNINCVVWKRAFCTEWWLKTSNLFWRSSRGAGVWYPGLLKMTCRIFLNAAF